MDELPSSALNPDYVYDELLGTWFNVNEGLDQATYKEVWDLIEKHDWTSPVLLPSQEATGKVGSRSCLRLLTCGRR